MFWDIVLTVIGCLVLLFLWVAIFDSNRFTRSHYELKNRKIKKKAHVVVLSDLHNKSYGENNEKLVEAIAKEKPDFILVAGDIINGNPKENIDAALQLMQTLAASYPVYYANGNHETRMKVYPEDYGDRYDVYYGSLEKYGVKLLVNEDYLLSDYGICVIGSELDRSYYKRFGIRPMESAYLFETLGKPRTDFFNILLAHNPDYFDQYVEYGAELVFSGHIHGGIVRIPFWNKGVLSPNVSFFPKYDGGSYEKNKVTMIVSRGLGMHTIPFRMFNPGDLVVVDLLPEEV